MKLGKLSTALGAGVVALSMGQAAMADMVCPYLADPSYDTANLRSDLVRDLPMVATSLRCDTDSGTWPNGNPIWKYRSSGDGCLVHSKLAKLLDEPRDSLSSPPPIKKGGNTAAGAANDLANGKDDEALTKLYEFVNTILYSAKLNPNFAPIAGKTAADKAADFRGIAEGAIACVYLL